MGYTEFVFVICGDAEHRRGGRGWANVRIWGADIFHPKIVSDLQYIYLQE